MSKVELISNGVHGLSLIYKEWRKDDIKFCFFFRINHNGPIRSYLFGITDVMTVCFNGYFQFEAS